MAHWEGFVLGPSPLISKSAVPTSQVGTWRQGGSHPFSLGEPLAGRPLLKYSRRMASLHLFKLESLFSFSLGKKTPKNLVFFSCQFLEASVPAACKQAPSLQLPIHPSKASFFRAEILPCWGGALGRGISDYLCHLLSLQWGRGQHACEGSAPLWPQDSTSEPFSITLSPPPSSPGHMTVHN